MACSGNLTCLQVRPEGSLVESTDEVFGRTGYTPSAEALQVVLEIADRLQEVNPDLVYVLDTVCGDNGKLYVGPLEFFSEIKAEVTAGLTRSHTYLQVTSQESDCHYPESI